MSAFFLFSSKIYYMCTGFQQWKLQFSLKILECHWADKGTFYKLQSSLTYIYHE